VKSKESCTFARLGHIDVTSAGASKVVLAGVEGRVATGQNTRYNIFLHVCLDLGSATEASIMLRTRSSQALLIAVAAVAPLVGAVALAHLFARHSSTEATLAGPLQVPPGEDPVAVQLDPPSEVIEPDGKETPFGEVREGDWIESGRPENIPLLIRYLKHEQEMIRSTALAEFAGMGPSAKSAVPAIVEALDDPTVYIRLQAATTLIQMNVQSKVAVGALTKELKADGAASRARAAQAIADLIDPPEDLSTHCWGPSPPPRVARPWVGRLVLPALVEAGEDQDEAVRAAAAQALAKLSRFVKGGQISKGRNN
jgi:hypothetical protein